MFDLSDRPRAWIEIAWPAIKPGEEDGLAVEFEQKIELFVEILDRDEMKKLFPRLMGDDETPEPSEIEVVMRLASDWRQSGSKKKILDKGREVPFTRKNVEKLIKVPMFGPSFTAAYLAAVGGKVKLREGNSASSPSGGRADAEQAGTGTTSSVETANDSG